MSRGIMEKYITAKDVAEMIGCKLKTVYHYATQKKIPSFKICGMRRFRARDIQLFIERETFLAR